MSRFVKKLTAAAFMPLSILATSAFAAAPAAPTAAAPAAAVAAPAAAAPAAAAPVQVASAQPAAAQPATNALANNNIAVAAANAFSPDQQKSIEGIVNTYLQNNPQIIISAIQSYQQKQMMEAENIIKNTQKDAPQFVQSLFHNAKDPIAGNPSGVVTIVEFFDYQCSHCIDMTPVISDTVKLSPNVRVVYKEFPIRGPVSEFAARAALAANMQGKYVAFHDALMKAKQPLSNDTVLSVAKAVGLNMTQLQKDMDSQTVKDQINANVKLAQDLKLLGTPAFFIGKTDATTASNINYIPGEIKQPQLIDLIKKNS